MFSSLKNEFDPRLLARMNAAFDLAWNYLETRPEPTGTEPKEQIRLELASKIIELAREGEATTLRLANLSIGLVRQKEQWRLEKRTPRLPRAAQLKGPTRS